MVTEKQPLDTDREGFFKVKKKKKKWEKKNGLPLEDLIVKP